MKKPSEYLYERQKRLARYARNRIIENRRRSNKENKFIKPDGKIVAPRKITIANNHAIELTKFLSAMKYRCINKKESVIIDFKFTEEIHVSGAILVLAEFDRIISQSKLEKPITIINPRISRTKEVLKQIGIHDLVNDYCDITPRRRDVIHWKSAKGTNQSGEKISIIENVVAEINSESQHKIELKNIWRGVSEVVSNAVDHAYLKPRRDGYIVNDSDARWWMLTQYRDDVFTVAVCDLGCGYSETIRETIPEKFFAFISKNFSSENRDSIAIRTAMEYGRSGTREGNRGKGSRDALSVVEKNGSGELVIVSNSGVVRSLFQGHNQWKTESSHLGASIQGTILWWKLPLKGIPND